MLVDCRFKRVFFDNNAAVVWIDNVLFGGAVCYFSSGARRQFSAWINILSRSVATPFLILHRPFNVNPSTFE
jgi:hypothetical protein